MGFTRFVFPGSHSGVSLKRFDKMRLIEEMAVISNFS